jgi:hypothetical protein
MDTASESVARNFGKGQIIGVHGSSDAIGAELGYGLTREELALSDTGIRALRGQTHINTLESAAGAPWLDLLRGPTSLGGLLQGRGWPATPSPATPVPGGSHTYYTGSYSFQRHGSSIDARFTKAPNVIQSVLIEVKKDLGGANVLLNNQTQRRAFAAALAASAVTFVEMHYGFDLTP